MFLFVYWKKTSTLWKEGRECGVPCKDCCPLCCKQPRRHIEVFLSGFDRCGVAGCNGRRGRLQVVARHTLVRESSSPPSLSPCLHLFALQPCHARYDLVCEIPSAPNIEKRLVLRSSKIPHTCRQPLTLMDGSRAIKTVIMLVNMQPLLYQYPVQ